MVRPSKDVRLKELGNGFQVLKHGEYVGRVSYQNLLLLARLSRLYGTDRVLVQLVRLHETLRKQGLGTQNDE